VTIYEYELKEFIQNSTTPSLHDSITLKIRTRCSSGTYIRALARDLGHELGTGGYVSELRRTAIGEFRVENAEKL
jgi:tRNA pseudouridine55 synthase